MNLNPAVGRLSGKGRDIPIGCGVVPTQAGTHGGHMQMTVFFAVMDSRLPGNDVAEGSRAVGCRSA
jgi:hypothetical protein